MDRDLVRSNPALGAAELNPVLDRSPRRIPSLDGLRAISILSVVVGHAVLTHGSPVVLEPLSHAGNLGVRMFFVISGFLITSLLLNELRTSASISLRDFYIRRTIRIWPAMYFYIAVVALLNFVGYINLSPGDLLAAATFTMNYHHDRAWALNHMWSLSVEEQFYILWPALVLFAGGRRLAYACLAIILIVLALRAFTWFAVSQDDTAMTREFQFVADALASGALLTCLIEEAPKWPRYMAFIESKLALLVSIVALAASFGSFLFSPGLFYVLMQSVSNLGMVVLLHYAISTPSGWFFKLLNLRFMVFIGTISYSLYLWQELFLNAYVNNWYTRFPQNIVLSFLAATISFKFVEKPFLDLRKQFSKARATL